MERDENHECDDHDQYQQAPETFSVSQSSINQRDQSDSDSRPGASCRCVRCGRYVHMLSCVFLCGAVSVYWLDVRLLEALARRGASSYGWLRDP